MISWKISSVITAATVAAAASTSSNGVGLDVVDNFCLRVYQQSVVKNDILYIDGGLEVFSNGPEVEPRVLGYNTKIIEIDMTSSWDWKTNISATAVNKTANPRTGTDPPLVVQGALFAGPETQPNVFLYGGTVSWANTSFPGWQPPASLVYGLWSFDTSDTSWSQYDLSSNVSLIPAGGAYAEAPNLGLAFYLGGFIDSGTANTFGQFTDFRPYLPGMIVIDLETQSATNLSTESLGRSPRMGGGMVYIEGVGSQGILLAMGGVTKPVTDDSYSNMGSYVTFDEIDFFDVSNLWNGNGTWYTQKTSGDIPKARTNFCLVAVSAQDGSSHNVYLYGGTGEEHYDDVYVLSVPSFTWTVFFHNGNSPRWGHTCHLVAGHQMITVGGALFDDFLQSCDWELSGVAILDLSTKTWGSVYNATYADYEVPEVVYQVIGGDAQGEATLLSPKNGWDNPGTDLLFKQSRPTATEPKEGSGGGGSGGDETLNLGGQEKKGLSTGTIAGAAAGSVVGVALIVTLAIFWVRRKRKQKQTAPEPEEMGSDEKKPSVFELTGGADGGANIAQLPDAVAPEIYEMDGNNGLRELHGHSTMELADNNIDNTLMKSPIKEG